MPKCDFNKVAIEITLRHECSPVNLLHIFRTPFPKNTSGGLLLDIPRKRFSESPILVIGVCLKFFSEFLEQLLSNFVLMILSSIVDV